MYTIQDHIAYHAWATKRMVATLDPVEESVIWTSRPSSFPSIGKTLLHLWDAETVWLKRFDGISLTSWPSADFKGDKRELLSLYQQTGDALLNFVQTRPDEVKSRIRYKNLKGEPYEDVIEDMLFHVVNHGSYHRGQIVTMLRDAGVSQVQGTDIIIYLRMMRGA